MSAVLFIDLKSAFDTIDIDILLKKIEIQIIKISQRKMFDLNLLKSCVS